MSALGPNLWDLGTHLCDLGPNLWDLGPNLWDLGPWARDQGPGLGTGAGAYPETFPTNQQLSFLRLGTIERQGRDNFL